MMDLRKWPEKIWPVCPELAPDGLEFNPGGLVPADDPDAEPLLECWTIDCDGLSIDPDAGEEWKEEAEQETLTSLIPPQSAAALIRDRAVWWLARYLPGQGVGRAILIEIMQNHGWHGTDPTEALYLACCKVLEIEP